MKTPLLPALLLGVLPVLAQLPAPNAAGVSAGHDIMIVKDLDAANKFWSTLGGEPAQLGALKLMKFPGVLFLMRQGMNQGGTVGSSVEYIGFKVKNLKESLAKWEAAGIRPIPSAIATPTILSSPDDIEVKVWEDKSLTVPIAADSLGMRVPNVKEAQDWYEKWFGKDIPGSRITFLAGERLATPTKGRAFDRIGLEVKNLEDFCKKLDGAGIKLDGKGYNKAKNMDLAVCLITDPFGTYIEMSEGLAAVK
jgi:catechol 2,3-dioxygenase-like lactoylglutathione lyase family enzyme